MSADLTCLDEATLRRCKCEHCKAELLRRSLSGSTPIPTGLAGIGIWVSGGPGGDAMPPRVVAEMLRKSVGASTIQIIFDSTRDLYVAKADTGFIYEVDRTGRIINVTGSPTVASNEEEDVTKTQPQTPVFAAVVQPAYEWTETVFPKVFGGETKLPLKSDDLKAEISTPVGETPLARAARLHELLHARFTPDVNALARSDAMKDVPEIAKQIAEDVRLAHLARERGLFDDPEIYFPAEVWNKAPKERPELLSAALYMNTYGQSLEGVKNSHSLRQFCEISGSKFTRRTRKALEKWTRETDKILKRGISPEEQFAGLAKATQVVLQRVAVTNPINGPAKPKAPATAGGSNASRLEQSGFGKDGKPNSARKATEAVKALGNQTPLQKAAQEAPAPTPKPTPAKPRTGTRPGVAMRAERNARDTERAERAERTGYGASNMPSSWMPNLPPPDAEAAANYSLDVGTDSRWGKMVTVVAPLQRNFKALTYRMGAAAPEGLSPKFLGRWYGDKNIFERKGRRRGGTLLIDASGSMSWAWTITKELIETTPAMTIAVYSGTTGEGQLTIIAKDGKLTDAGWLPNTGLHGDGNEVDGPALAWLARQARPRVWFSDNGVCAAHADPLILMMDAHRICRLAAIKRTMDPNVVIKIFTGRPPVKPIPSDAEKLERQIGQGLMGSAYEKFRVN